MKKEFQLKSPQAKAARRAQRNARSISTPRGEYKRYFKFQSANGAVAGRRGDKVWGRPLSSFQTVGVHKGSSNDDRHLRGRSAAGVCAEWSLRHRTITFRFEALKRARDYHAKKLAELRAMPILKLA